MDVVSPALGSLVPGFQGACSDVGGVSGEVHGIKNKSSPTILQRDTLVSQMISDLRAYL